MQAQTYRNIRLLSAFNFCNDFRIYSPIAVLYFQHVSGSYALGMLVFSIAKIASAAFELPTGILSDYAGRKTALVLGQIASVLCVASYAFGQSFAVLAIGAVLEGLSVSFFSGNNEALLYDTLKGEGHEAQYPEYQGRLSSMFQFALALSALTATFALGWFPFRALFWLSIVPQIGGLVFALLVRAPARQAPQANVFAHLGEALAGFARDVKLRDLSIAVMLNFALGEAKHMFIPAFFALFWTGPWLGIAALLSNGLAAVGFRAGGRLIARWRELPVLVWTNGTIILFGIVSTAVPSIASPAIYALASFSFGPAMVAQASLVQRAFSDRERATMGSLIAFGGNILFAIAVFAIGALADRIGPRYALLTAEIISLSVFALYWRLFRQGGKA